MTPVRLVCLVVTVFVLSLPVTFLMHDGPSGWPSLSADGDEVSGQEDNNDPVADVLCLKGAQETGNGDFAKAIASYTKAIERNPKYVFAYIGRGDAHLASGNFDRAIADYDRAIRVDPTNEIARQRAETVRQVRALE